MKTNDIFKDPYVVATTISITEMEGKATAEIHRRQEAKGGVRISKKNLSSEQISKIMTIINGEGGC